MKRRSETDRVFMEPAAIPRIILTAHNDMVRLAANTSGEPNLDQLTPLERGTVHAGLRALQEMIQTQSGREPGIDVRIYDLASLDGKETPLSIAQIDQLFLQMTSEYPTWMP